MGLSDSAILPCHKDTPGGFRCSDHTKDPAGWCAGCIAEKEKADQVTPKTKPRK